MTLVFRLCLVATALLALLPLQGDAQSELTTLHLIASPIDDVIPVLYAERAGLFRQVGLDVVVDRAQGGAATGAALANGSADIGKANPSAVIAAHVHGIDLKIVAPAAVYDPQSPDAVLMVAGNSPIHTARDLLGKVVGVLTLNEINVVAVRAWLDANHVDWKNVQFIELPYSTMVAALEQDRIQAALLVKPFITDAVNSGRARVLGPAFGAIAPTFIESAWVANADYIDKHKAVIQKFQRVVAQASAYANSHKSETVDLLASWTGITPEQAARTSRMSYGTSVRAQDIQPVINASAKYGVIDKPFDAQQIIFGG